MLVEWREPPKWKHDMLFEYMSLNLLFVPVRLLENNSTFSRNRNIEMRRDIQICFLETINFKVVQNKWETEIL